MKKMFVAASLALVLFAAVPAPAAQAGDAAAIAQGIADNLQGTVPRQYGDNLVLVAAQAQAHLLVLTVEFRNGASLTRDQLAHLFAMGFCEDDADDLFATGLRVRVDIRNGATSVPGIVIDRCPAR